MPWADEEKQKRRPHADGGPVNYSGGSDISDNEGKVFSAGPYGKHRLDLSIPVASDTDLTGQLSAAPNYFGPGRNDVGLRVGIRKRFADGGKVGKPRGDFFTVPHDALKALGRGDVGLGHAVLHDLLGSHVMSGKLGTIDPDTVTKLGGGDHAAGRRVLAKLVARIRSNSKPPSGQTIILRGNRANTAINVSKT